MLKLGFVDSINALPFHLPFRQGVLPSPGMLSFAPPSQLNAHLRADILDVALTSASETFSKQLAPFCISAEKEVGSVHFYAKNSKGGRVGVTPHSAASIALLKVLCHHFWKISPHFEPLDRSKLLQYEGILLIGDEALQTPHLLGYQTIDLAQAWYQETGLPFVFALFSCAQPIETTQLEEQLEEALTWSLDHLDAVVCEAYKQCPLPLEQIHRYFGRLNYRLGEKEREGLKLFQELCKYVPGL